MQFGPYRGLLDSPLLTLLSSSAYRALGVTFDGTNDYMVRGGGLTGAVDSRLGMASFWVNLNGGDAATMFVFRGAANGPRLVRSNANLWAVTLLNAAGTSSFTIRAATQSVVATGWQHVLVSWSTDAAAGAKIGQIYIDDVSDPGTFTDADAAFDIDYTDTDHAIGADTAGTAKLNADLADMAVWFGERLDLSVVANRRKFISVAGKPVPLGVDGSGPTGTPPIVFQRGPAATFAINRGTGGDFTVTGALTDAATSPSD